MEGSLRWLFSQPLLIITSGVQRVTNTPTFRLGMK
jgi:hypothetical protein